MTRNSLRNYVYLCAINSKAGNHSQCFQYSRTLQTVIEDTLEMRKHGDTQSDVYLEKLLRTLKKQGVSGDSKITIRVICVSFYYSGKSLVHLKNTSKAIGRFQFMSLPRVPAGTLDNIHWRLSSWTSDQQTAEAGSRPSSSSSRRGRPDCSDDDHGQNRWS